MNFATLAVIALVAVLGPLLALPRRTHLPVIVGELLAGIILGPTLLGYLLAAVGTARMPDGQLVNGQQLAPLLESQIYARIPTNEQRDIYFSAAGAAIYRALLASGTSPVRLLPALGRGAGEGRLLVWSRRPAEQRG